jgi:nucleotide-binding universal stress UspA family protein
MLILLPMDGTPASLAAAHHVIRLAGEGLRLQVLLANVQEAPHLYEVVLAHDAQVLQAASEQAGAHALAAAAALLQGAGLPVDCQVAHGEPGPCLLALAETCGCDAIVLTGQPPGLLGGGRLGPVAQWVLKHAGLPVTVVPQPEAVEPDRDADAGADADASAPDASP